MKEKQFNQANWDAFKRIPLDINEMPGATTQSVWRDDCLYVVEADLRYDMMKVKLVYHEEEHNDDDLRNIMHYLLIELHKLFAEHGLCLMEPVGECTDPKYNEFGIITND